ncbi:MAG: MFS transporter [Actinomycetota bacterium]
MSRPRGPDEELIKAEEGALPEPGDQGFAEELVADLESPPPPLLRSAFASGGALASFAHRDFSLLWSGAFVSNLGTLIHNTALLWYVKEVMHANRWVAAVNFANFAPIIIFVLWAGALADRLDRRRLIIVTQAVMAVSALALALATTLGWTSRNIWIILSTTFVLGTGFVFTFPAWRAFVPDIVPRKDMLNAIALDAAGFNMARFLGPAIAGLVLAVWSAAGAFYINAASFMAVIVAMLLIAPRPPMGPPRGSVSRDVRQGLSYVLGHRWALKVLGTLLMATFFGLSFIVLLPGFAKDVLHGGAWTYAALFGASGLGASVGAPLVTHLSRRHRENVIIKWSLLVFNGSLFLLAVSRWTWLSAIGAFFSGVGFLMASSSMVTVLQSRVERNMRGRIMSFYILVFLGSAPLGGLLLGALSDRTSVPTAMYVGACGVAVLMAALFLFPSILREAVAGQPTT